MSQSQAIELEILRAQCDAFCDILTAFLILLEPAPAAQLAAALRHLGEQTHASSLADPEVSDRRLALYAGTIEVFVKALQARAAGRQSLN
jgi:hypothetical protein